MRVVLLVMLVAGCKVNLEHSVDAAASAGHCVPSTSPSCVDIAGHSDLATIQKDVFSLSCSLASSCHKGSTTTPQGKIDLRDGMSHTTLTTMMSHYDATRTFVVPGDLGKSYLRVLLGTITPDQATPPAGPIPTQVGLMPQGSSMLCCQKLEAIDAWITAGAPAQ